MSDMWQRSGPTQRAVMGIVSKSPSSGRSIGCKMKQRLGRKGAW